MAATDEGRALTAEQRTAQLGVRAGALRTIEQLWRAVDPTNLRGTFSRFAGPASKVVSGAQLESGRSAAGYYGAFRAAEGAADRLAVKPAPITLTEAVESALRGAGLSGIVNARRRGASVQVAANNGLVKVLGEAGLLVLMGGRDTLLAAVEDDSSAAGWERVTSGGPCAFCSMLASRGPVYRSARSASFDTHPHCGCTVEPVIEGRGSVVNKQLGKQFKEITKGKSGKDALNAWRRELARDANPAALKPVVRANAARVPAAAAPFFRRLDGLEDLAEKVSRTVGAARVKLSGGQSAATEMVTLSDGARLVSKKALDWGDPDEVAASLRLQSDAEQLTSLMGRAVKAPVVRVYRESDDTVWMDFLDGEVIGAVNNAEDLIKGVDGQLLGLLDQLTIQADRNAGNIIVSSGRLTGIDHAASWGQHNIDAHGDLDRSVIQDGPDRPASNFSRNGEWVDNQLTQADITEIHRRLEELRPDFEHLGRGSWLDYSLRVLAKIAEHARGGVSILG